MSIASEAFGLDAVSILYPRAYVTEPLLRVPGCEGFWYRLILVATRASLHAPYSRASWPEDLRSYERFMLK